MKRPLLFKSLVICLLMLMLLIPIGMIGNSINERQAYSESVVRNIAQSSSYDQTLTGPVLVVPYTKMVRKWVVNDRSERILEERTVNSELYFLPELLRLNGKLNTELRQLGIYTARLYYADATIDGSFVLPAHYGVTENLEDYQFGEPFIAIGISDIRGIKNSLKLHWSEKEFTAEPGSRLKMLGDGVHIKLLDMNNDLGKVLPFSLELLLQGTGQLAISPVGKETHVNLHSDWPHPRFNGEFLPVERSISDKGFSARWQTSYFSTNMAELFQQCSIGENCDKYHQLKLGVDLIDPVNHYVKSDRAIKYALLFIALTFAGFFLFEVLKRLQVHPIQYGLVGLALALFYLLLLSLSEHIEFEQAYGISAAACVSLIGFYVYYVLRSVGRALGFTAGLACLYGLLYGLLSAEDYALLMGSLLLFAVLGAFMMLTRNVNWYAVGQTKGDQE
jgi:inner membrane protein